MPEKKRCGSAGWGARAGEAQVGGGDPEARKVLAPSITQHRDRAREQTGFLGVPNAIEVACLAEFSISYQPRL